MTILVQEDISINTTSDPTELLFGTSSKEFEAWLQLLKCMICFIRPLTPY